MSAGGVGASRAFSSFVGQQDERALAWARLVFDRVLGGMPLAWSRKGTCVETWFGRKRVAFAPHRAGASFYFRSRVPVAAYRRWGGACPTGKFSLRVPVGADFEAELLTRIVAEYLGLPRAGAPDDGDSHDHPRRRPQRPGRRGRPGG